VAPRPLLLVEGADAVEWPPTGYQRVQKAAENVYRLQGASQVLQAAHPQSPWSIEEIRRWLKVGPNTRDK
jgi:hypothetical protein